MNFFSRKTHWKEQKIGDSCIVGDGAHASLKRQQTGIMYLTSKNFKNGCLDLSKVDYISEEDYIKYFRDNSKALTKPQTDDVLFSIIGTIGEPYLFKPQDKFGLSSSVSILRPNNSVIFPKYLYYWIKGHIFQEALYGIKGGVAQSYVSLEMIRSLPLYYPPFSTQKKIAAILSAYDDLIENNTRRIKILEEMAQTLYHEWFVKFRFPGHEHTKMVDSKLGLIPEGWEVKRIKDICKQINYGYTTSAKSENTGIKFLRITDIVPSIINWDSVPFCEISDKDYKKYELLEGDIVIARTGATTGYAKRINKRHSRRKTYPLSFSPSHQR